MRNEEYIQTETGKRMLRAVTPIDNDEYRLSIFNANGFIMEEVHQAASKITTETLINNATWSLSYWESLFRIKPRDDQTVEQRRRAVILKMNEYYPVTRRRMETIVDTLTENGGTVIDDERGDYILEIILDGAGAFEFSEIKAAIEEVKPAHLAYEIVAEILMGLIRIADDSYSYPVYYKTCGEFSGEKNFSQSDVGDIALSNDTYDYKVEYPVVEKRFDQVDLKPVELKDDTYSYVKEFPVTGDMESLIKEVTTLQGESTVNAKPYEYNVTHPVCGEFYAEGE